MTLVFVILAIATGALCLWGLIAPRGQWRALAAWSVSNQHTSEPGGVAYGIRRLVSGLGVLASVLVIGIASFSLINQDPKSAPAPTKAELMWGSPAPSVLNRDIVPVTVAPEGLVQVPIVGYQDFGDDGQPEYIDRLAIFKRLGIEDVPGLVGRIPDVGFAAMDFATMTIDVRGAILCVPRQVVVIESETAVQIGVFYGYPDTTDGIVHDNAVECANDQSVTGSLLIPLQLAAPIGDREMQNLDGTPLVNVPPPA